MLRDQLIVSHSPAVVIHAYPHEVWQTLTVDDVSLEASQFSPADVPSQHVGTSPFDPVQLFIYVVPKTAMTIACGVV